MQSSILFISVSLENPICRSIIDVFHQMGGAIAQPAHNSNETSTTLGRVCRWIGTTAVLLIGPWIRSAIGSNKVYEYINDLLSARAQPRTTRNHRCRDRNGINSVSRPSFRRNSRRRHPTKIRINKAKIHINMN